MKNTTAMVHRTNNTTSITILIVVNTNNWLQIENIFYNVILMKSQYQRLQLSMIQRLIQIILYQLLIIDIVFMHILRWLLVVYIVIKIQLHGCFII